MNQERLLATLARIRENPKRAARTGLCEISGDDYDDRGYDKDGFDREGKKAEHKD